MFATFRAGLWSGLLVLAAAAPASPAPPGYLHGAESLDTLAVLPPAPAVESPTGVADRAIFRKTRALQGSPRWTLATSDAVESVPSILADLSCAAGVDLTVTTAPKLAALLVRLGPDVRAAVRGPKDFYRRQRPYQIDQGPLCTPRDADLDASPDYPSGHATWSWTAGLLLAELVPARASQILSRARAYGESRVVCGVHNASAIEAGRTNASALVAALHGQTAFRADLEGARAEVQSLRPGQAQAPDTKACAEEAALTAHQPW